MSSNEEVMRVQCLKSKLNGLSRAEGQEGEGRTGAKLWETSNFNFDSWTKTDSHETSHSVDGFYFHI